MVSKDDPVSVLKTIFKSKTSNRKTYDPNPIMNKYKRKMAEEQSQSKKKGPRVPKTKKFAEDNQLPSSQAYPSSREALLDPQIVPDSPEDLQKRLQKLNQML